MKTTQKLWYIDLITMSVCQNFNIDPAELKSPSHKRELADGRKVIIYLATKYIGATQLQLATKLRRNRSTMSFCLYRCADLMKSDKAFRDQVEGIKRELHFVSNNTQIAA